MKSLIKRMGLKKMMLVAQSIYLRLFNGSSKESFSQKQYHDITALKCIVSYNKYGGYCVPESSRQRPAAQKILSNDVYEPKTIEFMVANCSDGDIVHAGTYFGDFLPALSKGVNQNAKVWAFEPNPENYRCAKITLEINNTENVTLINAGLGEKQENLLVKTVDENGCSLGGASQIIARDSVDSVGAEVVKIFTVDDVVNSDRNVSIIQLDVEGHEKEALTGALKIIQRCLPTIILEILPNSTLLSSDWFSENILILGYRKANNIHGNTVFSCEPQNLES